MIPELDGRENVITELVVGMTGQDDNGISAYRDTLVRLPNPTDDDWVAFEDIDEAWVLAVAERTAAENKWQESIKLECEAAKTKPIMKPLSFQVKSDEVPKPDPIVEEPAE